MDAAIMRGLGGRKTLPTLPVAQGLTKKSEDGSHLIHCQSDIYIFHMLFDLTTQQLIFLALSQQGVELCAAFDQKKNT